jgi:hypothetical protein
MLTVSATRTIYDEIFNGMIVSEKRNKFVKLAEARVNRAIQDIRLIGNLSNKSAYEFDDEDVKKIFRALQKAADAAKQKFGNGDGNRESEFSLED